MRPDKDLYQLFDPETGEQFRLREVSIDGTVLCIGGIYRHFKGGLYQLMAIAREESTMRLMVVYRSLQDKCTWVRPFNEFFGFVDHGKYPEVKQKYRFEYT